VTKRRAFLVAFAATIAFGTAAIAWRSGPAAAPQARFVMLNGLSVSTAELRGKVVLVEFWATTCGICIKSMPRMVDTYRRFAPRGYEVVAVAMQSDRADAVAAFAEKRALPFKIALDRDGDIARQFGRVRSTPTSYLIDRRGRVLKRYVGEPDWAEFHALVDKALGS
jgi:peroxiredoxin